MPLAWATDPDTHDTPALAWATADDAPPGMHITHLPVMAAWGQRAKLHWTLDGTVGRGKPGRRATDRIASRWAGDPEPDPYTLLEERLRGIPEKRRRERNRAALAIRGWAHIV